MGGTPNEGIMTGLKKPRVGYQEGTGPDAVTGIATQLPQPPGFFTRVKDAIFPTTGTIIERMQKVQEAPSLGEKLFSPAEGPLKFRTKQQAEEFLEKNPNYSTPIEILQTGEILNTKTTADSDTDSDKDSDTDKGTGTKTTAKVSDEETIKSYMKMFSDAFGQSEEDASRERFLQLAKFGANLLGQPGGDLSGAIGRATAPSIEGLAAAEAARKAGDREVKLAAIKTAIEQMKDPTADKIRTLARIAGVPEADVAKLMITGSGDSKMDRIELTAKAIEENVGSSAALKIAQALEEEGAVLAQASPIEIDKKTKKPKEGVPDGYYYDDTGKLYKVKKGKPSIVKIK
jgi:hypothetical protein